jgi:hypothetical protein
VRNSRRFWAAVTGWILHEEDPPPGRQEYSVGPPAKNGMRLYFVGVPEPKVVKNRLHLDVIPPGDQQHELGRLLRPGASIVDMQPEGVGWVILADPRAIDLDALTAAGSGPRRGRTRRL